MSLDQQQTDFTNKLALHQSRRNQSIPTLSTLVGGAAATQSLWTQWANHHGRYTAVCTYESPLLLLEAWLSAAIQHCDLHSLALAQVAQWANRSVDQLSTWLAHVSDYQKDQFWQQLVAQSQQACWLKVMLQVDAHHPGEYRDALRREGIELQKDDLSVIAQAFTLASSLFPKKTIPGLLIRLPHSCPKPFIQHTILPALTQLVESVPAVPIGLLLSPSQSDELLSKLPESRAKAALRGGMVRMNLPKESELRQWLGDRGLNREEHLQPILRAAQQYGATEEILTAAVALAETVDKNDPADSNDGTYRSHPEWLLFQYLEARPTTAGQFQVNAQLDIPFGNRSMEVDFLADKAKVVVELDGYYHFQSSESYRRDRRKDIALQQKGFWVLRFLSDDVIANLEEILATIDQALSLRLAQASVQLET